MKWWLLALPLTIQALEVATMRDMDGDKQQMVAAVVFSDADVLYFPQASEGMGRRLEKFGYQSYCSDDHCFYSRCHALEHSDNVLYVRCGHRVLGVVSGSSKGCPDRVKGCRVEGLVTCGDEMSVEGRMASYLYPETEQGLIKRAVRCEWCLHQTKLPPAPSH